MIYGLADRLKQARKALGLSQREVAQLLQVSPALISSYETGERTPSVEVLLALSGLYRCSTDYLLGRSTTVDVQFDLQGLSPQQINLVTQLIEELKK